mmetsp:Transcript_39497/g.70870  ORF Transcript_39497/g.70870 Transcript_39497/m.70870 type:complete len:85 (+) Transcript_39497:313-567(+)
MCADDHLVIFQGPNVPSQNATMYLSEGLNRSKWAQNSEQECVNESKTKRGRSREGNEEEREHDVWLVAHRPEYFSFPSPRKGGH